MNLWRYQWLLFVAISAIVLVPFVILQGMNERVRAADRLLVESTEIDAALGQLLYHSRDLESAASAITHGIDTPTIRRRIAESSRAIPDIQRNLAALTSHSSVAQINVGALKAKVDQRSDLAMRIIATTDRAERMRLLGLMVEEFQMRDAAAAVQKEMRWALENRIWEATRIRQQRQWLATGAAVVQLALLVLLVWILRQHERQREAAEHLASVANARALTVMQSIREPIALINRDERVVMHNPAFEELYGDADSDKPIDGELIGNLGGDAWAGREVAQRLHDVVVRGRELWDYEVSQTTADGMERTMLLNAQRMVLPDRDDEVALITLSDITHQKAAETEISELNQQLRGKIEQVSDANRELEAFSYSVSHDLRAPLRHISGFAEKLGRQLGEDADERSRHYLATIDSSAKRMAALIDDLLVYSRLGRSALRLQPVDMQSLVEETRALLDSNAQTETPDRRIEWKIQPLPIVIADENMMRQVWINLLGNAVKYSAPRELTVVEVTHQRLADGRHEFTVTDNGVGFDMAYAGKLFGVFQRMHKASEFPGTGIGLANVQRVLVRHGGQISADSRPGEGASFKFTLPAMLDGPGNPRESRNTGKDR